ncbi:Coagulation factor V [Wickerhamomyces ciferrii]|uniref:Coagulation factor V n=1 Tax=Wickerhamomyces ciferrii (strain ATCC 14091 / BCRC 22168 / CBS 111 / JCM 3599 / NBRC 0793 / NRRL Y-1031 F-60-10) TaxID=1206466 RepID=K0KN42_WICCF|nr:Coagulation factor V [Wickerhamomyces ciferrii]CCH42759.1 Coagulation factor V [Wickerhamomyces ciferrii]
MPSINISKIQHINKSSQKRINQNINNSNYKGKKKSLTMSDEELLTKTRQRRANAGSRLKQLLKAEEIANDGDEDENEIDLLFQEDDDDAEFQVGDKDRYGYQGSEGEEGEEQDGSGDDEAGSDSDNDNDDDDDDTRAKSKSRPRSRSRSASVKEDGKDEQGGDDDDSDTGQVEDNDDMFSDSEDDDSGEDDSDEGERELQKQERAKKRQAQKKARQVPKIINQKKTTSKSKKKPIDQPKADTLLSLSRRQSSRMTAVQNKMDLVERLKEDEARRSSIKPVARVEYVELTQEERLKEALETEKYNISTLNKYKEQEIDKKKKQRALQLSKRKKLENIISYKTMPIFVTPVEEHELERFLMNRDTIRRKRDRRGRKSEKQKREEEEARALEEARKKRAAMFIIQPKSPISSPEQLKKLRQENLEKLKDLELPDSSVPPESKESTVEPIGFGGPLEKNDEKKVDELKSELKSEGDEKNDSTVKDEDTNESQIPKESKDDTSQDTEIYQDNKESTSEDVSKSEVETVTKSKDVTKPEDDTVTESKDETNDKKRLLSTDQDEDENDHKKFKITDPESSDNEILLITPREFNEEKKEKINEDDHEDDHKDDEKVDEEVRKDDEAKTEKEETENKAESEEAKATSTNHDKSQDDATQQDETEDKPEVPNENKDTDGDIKIDDAEPLNQESSELTKDSASEIKTEEPEEVKPIKSVKFLDDEPDQKDESNQESKSKEPSIEPSSSRETSEPIPEQPKIIFEGPPQKVGANFISFEELTKKYSIDEIKTLLFGSQSLLGPLRKSTDVETIYKVRASDDQDSQISSNNTDLDDLPNFEILQSFPKFGEYNKIKKEQVILETRKDIKIVLKTQSPSGIHLPNGNKKQCLISGKPAMYFDPKTGLPYGSVDAYKVIKDIQNGSWAWVDFPTGGSYVVNRDFKKHAKDVPEGFDD